MPCTDPGTVIPDELVAYGDGGAPLQVHEHLRHCPHCAGEANRYARLQRRLTGMLRRVACPSPHALGEYDLQLLGPDDRRRVTAHLRECPHCTDELHQLRGFLASEPAGALAGAAGRVKRLIATLLAPGPAPGLASVGVRAGAAEASRLYQAADVTIRLSAAGRASLDGLVWREAAELEAIAGELVTLTDARGSAVSTTIDDLGGFAFEGVPTGAYRLEVALGDEIVTIEDVRVGA